MTDGDVKMVNVNPEVNDLWEVAQRHVALAPGVSVQLICFEGEPDPGQPWGSSVEPACDAFETLGLRYRFFEEHRQLADAGRAGHQVLVHTGVPAPVLLALMRHELEHVRQYEQGVMIVRANEVVNRTFEVLTEHMPGAFMGLYPLLPAEQEASAQATALVRSEFGALPDELTAGPHHSLLTAEAMSGPVATLPARMIALLSLYPENSGSAFVERYTPDAEPIPALLALAEGLLGSDGIRLLAECSQDAALRAASEALIEKIPKAWAPRAFGANADWSQVASTLSAVQAQGAQLAVGPQLGT
jgi:hypothetical protein